MSPELEVKTRKVTLSLLLKGGQLSAASLASVIGISVQAMRRHLRNLECDELVESKSVSTGPGRPSNLWKLTAKGYDHFSNGKGSEKFAVNLLASIQSALDKSTIEDLLTRQALEQAFIYRNQIGYGKLQTRLQKLVELRDHEGHISDFKPCPDTAGSWYLNAFHCSITSIAEHFPIICDKELELIRQIFPDCNVDRVQWRFDTGHSCGFKITPNNS